MTGGAAVHPERGRAYTREEIARMVGGGSEQNYMPNKDGRILCLCLTQEYNPQGPQVVLVGTGPSVEHEAELFCAQKTPVPVFFKQKAHVWEYVGNYACGRWTDDPEEICAYEESSGRRNLKKVIFMERGE